MNEDEQRWHKTIAVEQYNRCWELMESDDRDPGDDAEMLAAAYTSRWHWGEVGGGVQTATGDWQIARACSLLGFGDAAIFHAERALRTVEAGEEVPDFMLASCLEGMARAHAAAGNGSERDRYIEFATEALVRIADEDDREEIARQIASVPAAG